MKVFWKSKMFWLNVIGGALLLTQYIGGLNIVKPEYIAAALAIGNFILRLITNQGLTLTSGPQE